MAIGFKKFVVGGKQTPDSVIDYLADPHARGDYYSEGGQAVLRWLATPRLQRLFALGGPVVLGRTPMRMLLEGRHPVTGEVIRRAGPNGTMVGAIDVTLSPAPKSVSVLWALADRETRHDIERMVWLASDFAVAELMRKPLVRQRNNRTNDVHHVAMDDIVGVQTLHTTARLSERGDGVPDPQLHVHSLLFGAMDATGRLRALDSHAMLVVQREIDAYASATLAEMFRLRGFPIARTVEDRGDVGWELAGIPAEVLRLASSRRAEITAEGPGSLREQYRAWCRERYGAEREPSGPAWDDFLAAHRGPKARLQGRELRQAWADQYEEAGWGLPAAHDYVGLAAGRAREGVTASDDNHRAIQQFRREFLADLCREHALVPETHVDAMTFEKAKGLIDVTTALRAVGDMFTAGDLLTAPDGRVTTLGIVASEQRARKAAEQLMDAEPGRAPDPEAVRRAIEEAARMGLPFDEHQTAAVHLATSGRRFVSITGPAGTGKGVTSGVIGPLWQALGHRVIALAVPGRTAQQAGQDARADLAKTIDGFVRAVEAGRQFIGEETVIVVDEAAMIDHARYAALLDVAARRGATVIQAGDDRQLSSVGPGGLWTLIHAAALDRGLAVELRTVRRAREAAEAQAWTDVREGRVIDALRHWQDRGRLRLYDSRAELQAGMVAEWATDRARSVMVVDTSNAERDVINRFAQERRALAGEVGDVELVLTNGCRVRSGDRVIFREIKELPRVNGRYRVPRVENGTEATVTDVDWLQRTVELVLHEPHGERTVTVGRDVALNLAYARHVQLGQGMTADGAGQVGVSNRTGLEHFYVMVSRARDGAVVHADRSAVAAMAAPGLGPVTERQEAMLSRLGLAEIPEDWTWTDASVEIEARRHASLGAWAMQHLTETMGVEPALAAHLVAQAITRRMGETSAAMDLGQIATAVREAVLPAAAVDASPSQAWEDFLARLEEAREAQLERAALARLLSREGRKEAVGDRPMAADRPRGEARAARAEQVSTVRDSRPADVEHALIRAWQSRQEQLAELPLPPREPDLAELPFDDGSTVARGQVVRFAHPDWLAGAARREVQPGDLGVVLGCHRGGVTWDYATVELVGGRRIEVWQTAQGISVEPDLGPDAVREAVPRPDQRDPTALNVFELANGARLMTGDQVRFAASVVRSAGAVVEAGSTGVVDRVERHQHNRAIVALDDGRQAVVHPLMELELVAPAHVPADAMPRQPAAVASSEAVPAAAGSWARPLMARRPLELVARWETTDRLPRALALYEALGQLHVSTAPEQEVVRLWLADPEAAIVVQTWAQVESARQAIAEVRAARLAEHLPDPVILLAEPAYWSRAEGDRSGEAALAPERAYVLAGLEDRAALTKALSVAQESHLVTTPPERTVADQQAMHAREFEDSVEAVEAEAAALAERGRDEPAQRAMEVAIEAGLRQAEVERQAEREAHEAEHGGAGC